MSRQRIQNRKEIKGPLEGIIILDLGTRISAPFAGKLLADLGAEVIKVESEQYATGYLGARRELSNSRYVFEGENIFFLAMNRNKKSIAVDLDSAKGKDIFYDLAKKVDVVLDNFRPGVLKKIGIDYEALADVNPRIISCSITGFGPTGPYSQRPCFDAVAQCLAGVVSLTTLDFENSPVLPGIFVGDYTGAFLAVIGIVSAVFARKHTGHGQNVDISILDGVISLVGYDGAYTLYSGNLEPPLQFGIMPGYGVFKTKTGSIFCGAVGDAYWKHLCRAIERNDLSEDPKYATLFLRQQARQELNAIISQILLTRSTAEWAEILQREDVPFAPINGLDGAFSDPQVLHRDMVVTLESPQGNKIKQVGNPIKISGFEPVYEYPPLFGQHTDEILSQVLGYSREKIKRLRKQRAIS